MLEVAEARGEQVEDVAFDLVDGKAARRHDHVKQQLGAGAAASKNEHGRAVARSRCACALRVQGSGFSWHVIVSGCRAKSARQGLPVLVQRPVPKPIDWTFSPPAY